MNSRLLSRMAVDLRLFKFNSETERDYIARVIYSGVAHWMKIIPLEGYTELDSNQVTVSKKFFTERSKVVLDEILGFFPEVISWFYESDDSEKYFPIHCMQKRLIDIGEVEEYGFTNRIKSSHRLVNELLGGLTWRSGFHNNVSAQYNGVSMIEKEEEFKLSNENKYIDSIKYLMNLIESSEFTISEQQLDKEYFNSKLQTDTFYKSWSSKIPDSKYFVSRIKTKFGQYIYYLELYEKESIKSCQIDSYFEECGGIYRILLALRYMGDNPIKVKIHYYKDHFELTRNVNEFPCPEELILVAFGWPKKSISDVRTLSFHNHLIPLVKCYLENLLLNIEEVQYE